MVGAGSSRPFYLRAGVGNTRDGRQNVAPTIRGGWGGERGQGMASMIFMVSTLDAPPTAQAHLLWRRARDFCSRRTLPINLKRATYRRFVARAAVANESFDLGVTLDAELDGHG